MSKFLKYLACCSVLVLLSCTIKIPDIKITGEKTALENQILGEYNKVKEDAWMMASERGSGKVEIPKDKKEIIEAIRNRDFNKDDVDEFKINGLIGEKPNGLIGIADSSALLKLKENDKRLLDKVFAEENRDRSIIIKRITEVNTDFQAAGKGEVEKAFYSMNLEESPKGTYYLNPKGIWEKK